MMKLAQGSKYLPVQMLPGSKGKKKHRRKNKRKPSTARDSKAYARFRMKVFRRDGFTCQKCRSTKDLVVHHCFDSYADNVHRRLDVVNGVTLCQACHAQIHPWLKPSSG